MNAGGAFLMLTFSIATQVANPEEAAVVNRAMLPTSIQIQSVSVIVPDYDVAKDWYVNKLGFTVQIDAPIGSSGERFIRVGPPNQANFGIVLQKALTAPSAEEPEMSTDYRDRIGKMVNIVLRAEDVPAYAAFLESRGVKLTSPVRELPWGTQTAFKDLYGNSFVVIDPK